MSKQPEILYATECQFNKNTRNHANSKIMKENFEIILGHKKQRKAR